MGVVVVGYWRGTAFRTVSQDETSGFAGFSTDGVVNIIPELHTVLTPKHGFFVPKPLTFALKLAANVKKRSMTNDPALIDEMLRKAKTIAVVGMSNKSSRASYNVGRYLAANGYRVIPVNPALTEVLGLKCYPDLDAAQSAARQQTGAGIDLVDVFRASEHVPAIVDDTIRLGIPYLWLQDGVFHEEAVERARAAGIQCVQDDCIFRQHGRRHR